jgi:hypothetical protein
MADNGFISSPSGMSNAQQGTRGLSAGDWVRLQRLRGSRTYNSVNLSTNKDIAPPQSSQFEIHNSSPIMVFPVVGTSKVRRTASNWVDYIASQTSDFVVTSQNSSTNPGVRNTVTKLCNCSPPSYSVKKTGQCRICNQFTHVRIM